MIDYSIYCQIQDYYHQKKLTISQIAKELKLSRNTVKEWINSKYTPRKKAKRSSKLDAYKSKVVNLLHKHPYSVNQVMQRIKEDGYNGSYTILKEFISTVRPNEHSAYLTLHFEPGECAQIDWGEYKSVRIGSIRRRLSFFVMVLCYSRMLYVEFTLKQTMEHFLSCQKNAFEYFGGVPKKIMHDNLKTAVLECRRDQPAIIHPRYRDFSEHYGFKTKPCNVRSPHEKGRVENAVGYIKKNFLNGLDLNQFSPINPAARIWMETVANVRVHSTVHEQPAQLFKEEKSKLSPLPCRPYDVGVTSSVLANSQFRVVLDTNKYSVPCRYASKRLSMRVYPERILVYSNDQLIADHPRCYDRYKDFEHPDHVRPLLQKKRCVMKSKIMQQFMQISKLAEDYYNQLVRKRFNADHHIQKIVALSEIYGPEKVSLVLEDAYKLNAYSSEYIANILELRERKLPEVGALHLTHKQDLLDLEAQKPDLSVYED